MKKKLSLMLAVVMILQVVLPMATVIWETGFANKAIAVSTLGTQEVTVGDITWTFTVSSNDEALNVKAKNPATLPESFTIPSKLGLYTVKTIGQIGRAGLCNHVKSITIPSTVTAINSNAFNGIYNLETITIPSSVTSIGASAFEECSELTNVQIPEGVTTIGERAFYNCSSLESITIPKGVTTIEDETFSGCNDLKSIKFSEGLKSIGVDAFGGCGVTSIEFPNSLTEVKTTAFWGCENLKTVMIPNNNTEIGTDVFMSCDNLEKIYCKSGSKAAQNGDLKPYISIDDNGPTISVTGNATSWTKNSVTLKVTASDDKVGLADKPYSFDGGTSWQTSASKTYSSNTSGIKIKVKDRLGNVSTKEISITKIDKGGPTVTSVTGNATSWTKNSVTLKVNASDTLSGIKEYSFDGGASWQTDSSKTYSKNTNGITIKVRDAVGNETTYGEKINITKIDKTEPTVDVEQNTTQWTRGNVTLTITANDGGSGLADKPYSFDGGTTWQTESSKEYIDNTREIVVKVKDKAGNIATLEDLVIGNIDKEAPIITGIAPTIWTKEMVQLTIFAEDASSGMLGESYSFDGGETWQIENTKTYTENVGKIVIKVRDAVGNVASQEINMDYIDREAPIITNIEKSCEGWTKESITLKIFAEDKKIGLASQAYSFDGGVTWQKENEKTFDVYQNVVIKVRDSFDNVVTQNVEIKIDREAPTITSVTGNATSWTKDSVELKVDATDGLSGIESYSFDGGSTWQEQNSKTYTENTSGIIIKVRDSAGNETTYEEINITQIDKEAPVIESIEKNPDDWTKESIILKINAKDTLSGIEAYSFDGGTTWQEEPEKIFTENKSGIVIKVRDAVGNETTYGEEISITKIIKLEGIEITKLPDKTKYVVGQNFDKSGMEVTAKYNNETSAIVTNYIVVYGENLELGQTNVTISYEENGVQVTTKVGITVEEEKLQIQIEEYIQSGDEHNKHIENILPGTTIEDLMDKIETNGTIKIYKGTEEVTEETTKIGTGMKIKITLNEEEVEYTAVVKGDLNGDGEADDIDLLRMLRYQAGLDNSLTGEYLRAANVHNADQEIDDIDLLKLARILVGLDTF